MNWQQLLSDKRLGNQHSSVEHNRSAFQKDVDRIIFSSAFRRLQDKTQVFPLAKNDYVRTRLTHSLEVSSVGRSLGTLIGKHVIDNNSINNISADDFGSIVAAACLAHDIGNPPFGHFGEQAIRSFFLERSIGQEICAKVNDEQRQDLVNFEGNFQGFRILTRLQNLDIEGGMQLTYATLGAFTKYPCTQKNCNNSHISNKKNGLSYEDAPLFNKIAQELGLINYKNNTWARHPLVYLTEAADDICYAIIDIEDAYQIKQLDFTTAFNLLRPLAANASDNILNTIKSPSDKLCYLRAKAIGNLIQEAINIFIDNEKTILLGQYKTSISDAIPSSDLLSKLTNYAAKHIYNCPYVLETQMAGYRVLGDLLELFYKAVEDVAKQQNSSHKAKAASIILTNLIPTRFIGKNRQFATCPYKRSLKIIDYISGMTDSYAVNLYKKLTGISI